MIKEEYVSFEVARLLKDKGFDEPTIGTYNIGSKNPILVERPIRAIHCEAIISAPTQAMAMMWLREVHKVHIIAEPCLGEGSEPNLSFNRWFWTILTECGEYKPIRKIDEFPTYEQACEDAIKYCLENLI